MFEPMLDLAPLLYACCIPVQGRSRLLIYDLQRQQGLSLPGSFATLFTLLDAHRGETLAQLTARLPPDEHPRWDALLRYLLEQELLYFTATPERFPPVSLAWAHPSPLLTVLVDVDEDSSHDFPSLLAELEALRCERLSLRLRLEHPLDWLERFFVHWNPQGALTLDIQVHTLETLESTVLRAYIARQPRIARIQCLGQECLGQECLGQECLGQECLGQEWSGRGHSAVIQMPPSGFGILTEAETVLDFDAACAPTRSELCFNQMLFCESQRHHTFVHRRICISARGALKSTVGDARSFGQLGRDSLASILTLSEVQEAWALHKGRIEGCDGCEYRHACVDPRLPEPGADEVYRQTSACHYDPVQGMWRD